MRATAIWDTISDPQNPGWTVHLDDGRVLVPPHVLYHAPEALFNDEREELVRLTLQHEGIDPNEVEIELPQ